MNYWPWLINSLLAGFFWTLPLSANHQIFVDTHYDLLSFEESKLSYYVKKYGLKETQVVARITLAPGTGNSITLSDHAHLGSLKLFYKNEIIQDDASDCSVATELTSMDNSAESLKHYKHLRNLLQYLGKNTIFLTVIDGSQQGCKIVDITLKI